MQSGLEDQNPRGKGRWLEVTLTFSTGLSPWIKMQDLQHQITRSAVKLEQ